MNIPEPPPLKDRSFQLLTRQGDRIVRSGKGALYRRLLKALRQANPDCFDSDIEAGVYLQRYVWPPLQAERLLEDLPHLPCFPASMEVAGKRLQLLVTNSTRLAAEVLSRKAVRDAYRKT